MASRHGLSSLESPAPVNSGLPDLSTRRGALLPKVEEGENVAPVGGVCHTSAIIPEAKFL
jgi:hypothetical protein